METLSVVEALDPVDNIESGLRTRWIPDAMEAFDLQSLEEALHRGVVPAVGSPAHRLNHLVILDQFSVRRARVLATAVGMHHQSCIRFSLPISRLQRLAH